jgi:signal transduction histidine kinase
MSSFPDISAGRVLPKSRSMDFLIPTEAVASPGRAAPPAADLRRENERLRLELAAVALERDTLRRVSDLSPSALLLVDAQGRTLLANQRCREWFGLAALPSDSRALGAALAAGLDDGASLQPWLPAALSRHEAAGAWKGHTRAGLAVEIHGRRIELAGGGVGCLLRATDGGADAEVAMLRNVVAAARGADQAKADFLSRASHELRTPLNAVLGFAQLLGHSSALAGSREQGFVEHIVQAGRHLQALIDDLLQLSGIESGHLNIRKERVELGSLVDTALVIVQPLAGEHGVQLVWQAQHLVWAEADATRMRQVLINLLSNAIKYNRRGGRVVVTLGTDPLRPALTIADNGFGMSAHQLAHLFEPFNRLGAERGRIPGTGLGMAITRQLMERMGGRLEIHSEPDVGTTVHLAWNDPLHSSAAHAATAG